MKTTLIVATTADGFIAASEGQNSLEWTCAEDKAFFVSKTKEIGTMVMGLNTWKTIGKPLKGRRIIVLTPNPEAHLPLSEGETKEGVSGGVVEFVSEEPVALLKRLEGEGVSQLAICGGAYVYSQFLKLGLVDEIYMTVEPILFGSGTPFVKDLGAVRLERLSATSLGNATLMQYRVVRP